MLAKICFVVSREMSYNEIVLFGITRLDAGANVDRLASLGRRE